MEGGEAAAVCGLRDEEVGGTIREGERGVILQVQRCSEVLEWMEQEERVVEM